jgi:hypothetical protein
MFLFQLPLVLSLALECHRGYCNWDVTNSMEAGLSKGKVQDKEQPCRLLFDSTQSLKPQTQPEEGDRRATLRRSSAGAGRTTSHPRQMTILKAPRRKYGTALQQSIAASSISASLLLQTSIRQLAKSIADKKKRADLDSCARKIWRQLRILLHKVACEQQLMTSTQSVSATTLAIDTLNEGQRDGNERLGFCGLLVSVW